MIIQPYVGRRSEAKQTSEQENKAAEKHTSAPRFVPEQTLEQQKIKTRIVLLALLLAAFVVIVSCVNQPSYWQNSGKTDRSEAQQSADTGSNRESQPDSTPEFTILESAECSTASLMWNTLPVDGTPLVFTSHARLMDRDEEQEKALLYAAKQAAFYFGLAGEATFLKQKDAGGIGYLQSIDIRFDENRAEQLLEDIEIVKGCRDARGTYLVVRIPSMSVDSIPYTPKRDSEGRPAWIKHPPEIPEKIVGVGVAQRKRFFSDSIKTADERAVEELLRQSSANIKMIQQERTVEGSGTAHGVTSLETAKAELDRFYILSRWRSGDYFYTLAACDQNNTPK